MAQQLQNITIAAPGFGGINTQDSPLMQSQAFAAIADNAIIDKQGRIAARKGHEMQSTNGAGLLGTSNGTEHISEFVQQNGTKVVLSGGNLKIFTGLTTLVDTTPAGYTITANNWSNCTLNNRHYLFQRNHEPLVYDANTSTLSTIATHPSVAGVAPDAHVCLAAYGRVWAADTINDKKTLYWSDSLNGLDWSTGTSGSLDLTTVWPSGYDVITAVAAHNNLLIIFGKQNILIYAGANDPASMTLSDVVSNIGAVNRDAVVNTGKDIIFGDHSGIRSLGRTIQEKSSPIGDISRNINFDIKNFLASDGDNLKMVFDPTNAFIVCAFTGVAALFVFDTRFPLENGSFRATTWTNIEPLSMSVFDDEQLYIGVATGVAKYATQTDNGSSYVMSYFSHPMDFGDSSRIKFLKKINLTTFHGSDARVSLQYAYDYKADYTKRAFSLPTINAAQYNVDEYNSGAEYSTSPVLINTKRINAGGSGSVVQIGLETTVNGKEIAIQQLNVQSLVGRML